MTPDDSCGAKLCNHLNWLHNTSYAREHTFLSEGIDNLQMYASANLSSTLIIISNHGCSIERADGAVDGVVDLSCLTSPFSFSWTLVILHSTSRRIEQNYVAQGVDKPFGSA